MDKIKRCHGHDDCITITYSILGDPKKNEEYEWIDEIMKEVAHQNDFEFRKDVKKLTVGTPKMFYDYIDSNRNTSVYSILWCTEKFRFFDNVSAGLPCTFGKERHA